MCGRAYPAHHDYHSIWDLTEWKHVLEDVTMFFKAVVGKNFSDEEVTSLQVSLPNKHCPEFLTLLLGERGVHACPQ